MNQHLFFCPNRGTKLFRNGITSSPLVNEINSLEESLTDNHNTEFSLISHWFVKVFFSIHGARAMIQCQKSASTFELGGVGVYYLYFLCKMMFPTYWLSNLR